MDKFEVLLAKRQLVLSGKIDRGNFQNIAGGLAYLNAQSGDEVVLFIDSNGGFVDLGLGLYDMLAASESPVKGIVCGAAHSMAAVVLQACSHRIALPHSEMFVHPIEMPDVEMLLTLPSKRHPFGDLDMEKVREKLSRPLGHMQNICEIFVKKTHRSAAEVIKLINASKTLTAKEALAFGLIDEISEKP